MLWGAELDPSLSKDPKLAQVAPPLAVAPIEEPAQVAELAPALQPAHEPRGESGHASAAAAKPVAPNEVPASKGAASGVGDLRDAFAAKLAANQATASKGAASGGRAVSSDESRVSQSVSLAVSKGEQCDRWNRATGTAQLSITFAPSGKVSRARLVGEPIASAPVARCILHHARASSVPAFDGPAITVSREITLR